jgi:DNA-directed RNA polymerase subunit RPC12/RpoP
VRLRYLTKDRHGSPADVNKLVPFAYTPTGGRRQWLRCLKCGRGCRKIYGGRYFRCRLCYRLRYASQRKPDALVDARANCVTTGHPGTRLKQTRVRGNPLGAPCLLR